MAQMSLNNIPPTVILDLSSGQNAPPPVYVPNSTGSGAIPFKTYEYVQSSPSSIWTIAHNLGRNPSVTVVNNLGIRVEPDVIFIDLNIVRIIHGVAITGRAFCN